MISSEVFILHFKIIGSLFIVLSLLHVFLPSYMNWKEELKKLSLINRQVMQVHTFFIALVVFLMGALCLFASEDLTSTRLGKVISLGLGIFWFIRLIFQFFAYSPKIWKGKTFESIIHILASVFWTYLTIVFFMNYFSV